MDTKRFLECIKDYNFNNARILASEKICNGGWEVWFQVELAMYLKYVVGKSIGNFEREKLYPQSAAGNYRCDLYFSIGNAEHTKDETYVELKCQNPFDGDPVTSVCGRFVQDLQKQIKIHMTASPATPVVGFCVAAVYTTPDIIERLCNEIKSDISKTYLQYKCSCQTTGAVLATGHKSIYNISNIGEIVKYEIKDKSDLFIIAISP